MFTRFQSTSKDSKSTRLLSCDKCLPLDTGNRSGSQENVFANHQKSRQGQPDSVPKIVFSFHLSRAMSLAPHRAPSTSSSTFSSVPGHQRLLTSRNPGDKYTDPEPLTEQAGGNGKGSHHRPSCERRGKLRHAKKDCWYSDKNQPPFGVGKVRADDGNKGKNK